MLLSAVESKQEPQPKCEICGDGYTPDERMLFGPDVTASTLIRRAYDMLAENQLRAQTIECLLAKAIELEVGGAI